jgi:hypothetical protein
VEPRRVHLVAAKRVMRYLKGTLDYGICYTRDHEFTLLVILIQIGLEVSQIKKSLQDVVSVWGQP